MAGWTTVSGTSSIVMAILDIANTQGQSVLMSPLDSASNHQGRSSLGGHEVSHAAEHDRVGLSAFQSSLVAPQSGSESNGVMQIKVGVSPEEARATSVET